MIRSIETRTGVLQLDRTVAPSPSRSTDPIFTGEGRSDVMSLLRFEHRVEPSSGGGGSSSAEVEVEEGAGVVESYEMLNRNARKPKKANHGKRPCSRWGRRKRARQYGNPRRGW